MRMRTIGIAGVATLASVTAAGCGDERSITVHANRAALVAIDTGGGWAPRPAGDVTFAEPDGLYRIAVTCRLDIGDTTFVIAAPGDADERWLDCLDPPPGSAEVTFDVSGDVYGMFIGDVALYGGERTAHVDPGTYDVVATRLDRATGTDRVQVIRDVVIDGPTRVAIDVTGRGAPLEPIDVLLAGGYDGQFVEGTTARGTWFQLAADTPGRLPATMRVTGDHHWIDVTRFARTTPIASPRARARAAVGDGPVEIVLPTSDATASFVAGPPPAFAWSSIDGWDEVVVGLAQDNTYGVPGWRLRASRRAIELGAALVFPEPPPGWREAWNVDTARYYFWWSHVSRARADGGWELIQHGGGVYDPGRRAGARRPMDAVGQGSGDGGGSGAQTSWPPTVATRAARTTSNRWASAR